MSRKLSREENRRAWLLAALIVGGLLLVVMLCAFRGRWRFPERVRLPEERAETLAAAGTLDDVTVDAAFDPENSRLTATQVMTLSNRTGEAQSAVVLRSYSGAYLTQETSPAASDELFPACYGDMFRSGGLTLLDARVEGNPVDFRWLDEAQTVLSLPADWRADTQVKVTLRYRVDVPECRSRFGFWGGVFALGNVFPTAAVWQDGAWRTEPYTAIGDPFLSECANWTVRLTLPEGYTVAATGAGETVRSGGMQACTLEAKAVRDFCLVIGKDWSVERRMESGVELIACASKAAYARRVLDVAARALRCYTARYGDYLYPTLTLAEVDFPFGGMEYPRLCMIGSDALAQGGDTLAEIVAHEAAHQWWAIQVGSDGWYQPWQDEALCEYAWLDYVGDTQGEAMRQSAAFDRVEAAMRLTLPGDITPAAPLDYFANLNEYTLAVYRRGAALWLALENYLGRDGLDALLRDYQTRFRFRIASREDLTELISLHAGIDMAPLMLDYLDTQITH